MIYGYYFLVSLFLIILKTTIFGYLPFFDNFYDPLIPLVLYLTLFRRHRESIIVLFTVGFIMDCISGGPFGIYLTTYSWLFAGIRGMMRFVRLNSSTILLFIVACGMLLENLIYFITMILSDNLWPFSTTDIHIISIRFLWALLTGPPLLLLIGFGREKWENWMQEHVTAKE